MTVKSLLPLILREKQNQQIIADMAELFTPNPGQKIMGRQIFSAKTRRNWFQFGRDSGKSFGGAYCKGRFSLTNPKTYACSVFPERAQGQKVLWDSGYLREKIPQKYLLDQNPDRAFNKSELLVLLDNGSYFQILGSDNPDSLRGIKPDFCDFDEMRDFKSDVYDIMEANLIGKILNILSTPPDVEGPYTELLKMFQDAIREGDANHFFMELPTYVANDRYAPGGPLHDELMAIKRRLVKRGELSKWLREYEAKFIPGGVGSVFKRYQTNKRHIERDPSFLTKLLKDKAHRLEWYCIADPSQNGCFAVLFIAYDKSTGIIYILDEIAESDNANTGSLDMWHRMKKTMHSLYPYLHRWHIVYDEAAAWFYNDLDRHGVFRTEEFWNFESTHKSLIDKSEQMSLLKDIFAERGRIFISRKCENCISQVENYVTNKKGEYHKDQPDDFVDDLRYFLQASDFQPFEMSESEVEEELEPESFIERLAKRKVQADPMTGDVNDYGSSADKESDGQDDSDEFPFGDEFY